MNSSKTNGIIFWSIDDTGMEIWSLFRFFKYQICQILAKEDNVVSMATD